MLPDMVSDRRSGLWTRLLRRSHRMVPWSSSLLPSRVSYSQFWKLLGGLIWLIGEPADNAAYFFKWLSNLQGDSPLSNIKYAVFGCGNRDWVQTYQRIPRLIDELITKNGGKALIPRGEGDAGGSEIFRDFDNWEENLFKKLTEVNLGNSSPYRRIHPFFSRNTVPLLRRQFLRLRLRRYRRDSREQRRSVRPMLPLGKSSVTLC